MAHNKTPIYTAFAANTIIAIVKLVAAAATGSSAMASEGIHSLVDTSNEILLLLGISKSQKPADEKRPFGYGKELYFWSFVVSLLFFALGGGFSIYEGIEHLMHPEAITSPMWNYVILGIAFLLDGYSLITALKEFNRQRGDTPFWKAVHQSKDPATFVVLFEDAADVIGILIAFFGILLAVLLHNPYIDGVASVLIGLLLTAVAVLLVRESHSLLMGETGSPAELSQIITIVENDDMVQSVLTHLSMYMGPEEVVLLLKIKFDKGRQNSEVVDTIHLLRQNIQTSLPRYKNIFIEPV
ncbi:cation diffusion facilitator family transporter [Mucilaginibacter xinganensis]|uniref:Cation transporter n=1 Tax=Mucilaginibacter xinganensis TaxID=1234841 RepID=A0A223NZU0_9SPHI|nr:cation diffusion facilitator family transporter [Mucilaginibacter xinganensis]ASU35091.1 cation transporter [Mucilaginibacter xinganensis]